MNRELCIVKPDVARRWTLSDPRGTVGVPRGISRLCIGNVPGYSRSIHDPEQRGDSAERRTRPRRDHEHGAPAETGGQPVQSAVASGAKAAGPAVRPATTVPRKDTRLSWELRPSILSTSRAIDIRPISSTG